MGRWTVSGADKVRGRFEGVKSEALPALGRGLLAAMQIAFLESQKQVPVKTGVLKNSGQLLPPVIAGETVRVAITYGGAASAYALIQHDDVTLNHSNGQKAKYVLDPVTAALPDMKARCAAELAKIVG